MNVLVVEDDEALLVLAISLLEELGHTACSATGIDQALALLETDQVFDLLFTDLSLHGHDQAGLTLAVEVNRRRPTLPILYTTGQSITDGMKAMFVKGSSTLRKPFTFDQLKEALGAVENTKPR